MMDDAYTHKVSTWNIPEEALRDFFAAVALAGILAGDLNTHFETDAEDAYKCADAMLKARKKRGK